MAQGDRGIQIIEDCQAAAAPADELGCSESIWAVRRDNRHIGVEKLVTCFAPDAFPVFVKQQLTTGERGVVAGAGVIGYISLEKAHVIAPSPQRLAKPAP